MRSRMMICACMVALFSFSAFAVQTKVVYGTDDRKDVFETDNTLFLNLARSTAAMIAPSGLRDMGDGTTKILGGSLSESGICADQKFATQVVAANCSGFLVGDDLLVTAGHCIRSDWDCTRNSWVFDFYAKEEGQSEFYVPTSSVYKCKKIVERKLDDSNMDDFALIQLEKVVSDRSPLEYRKSGSVKKGDSLVVIGHPTGIPTKISDNAVVRDIREATYFQSNLDTFAGNSGSAVFSTETGLIEGILVRGENDYVYDSKKKCRVPNKCTDAGCRGEDVTRITNIKALKNL